MGSTVHERTPCRYNFKVVSYELQVFSTFRRFATLLFITQVPMKVLNQRCFVRLGRDTAFRPILPAVSLHGTTTLALLEALERVSRTLDFTNLAALSNDENSGVVVQVLLADSHSSNLCMFTVISEITPKVLHWLQRCESHTCNLITNRPFRQDDLINPIYCLSKLLRTKEIRDRLLNRLESEAKAMVRSNIFPRVRPTAQALK